MPLRDLVRTLARRRTAAGRRGGAQRGFRHVFVVTYGRSGSTLLQGLLNSLPGTVVRGENGLFVVDLFRAHATAADFAEKHRKHNVRKVESAFYGLDAARPGQVTKFTRNLMTRQLLGDLDPADVAVLGFKEVLWHRVEPDETERFFAWFDEVFPDARFVLNQRGHDRVVRSGFWQHRKDEVHDAIARVEEIQDYLRQSRPDRVLDMRYEEFSHDDRAVSDVQLRALAEFVVGRADDTILDGMRERLAIAHGPRPFGATKRVGDSVER